MSPNGQFVVSCGADRVLRLYEKTDQPLVLQDEEEEEREAQDGLATGEQSVIAGQPGKTLPSKKTIGSEKAVSKNYYFVNLLFFLTHFIVRLKVFWNVWTFPKNTRKC